jgi:hypothetical protein
MSKNQNIVDWYALQVEKFAPTIYSHTDKTSCGSEALSILTGDDPHIIDKSPIKGKSKHWGDGAILKYLQRRGIKNYPIRMKDVKTANTYVQQPITDKHVVLLSMRATRNQSTWCVLYKGTLYHCGEILSLPYMEFINNKLYTSYVVFKKDWGYKS